MSRIAESLARSPVFRGVDARALAATAPRWSERALAAGELLWYEGEPAAELALVLTGELEVVVEGLPISRVQAGELAGEAATFVAGDRRTATVRARAAARLLT